MKKITLLKLIFLLYFCTTSLLCLAQENWVEVTGYADMSAGKPVARRQALVDAYRQAISEGGIIEIGSYSESSNFMMVTDVMKTQSHGFIKRYEVVSEGIDNNDAEIFAIKIKALVVTGLGDSDDEGLSAFINLIGKPKVLFLVMDPQGEGSSVSTSESYLAEAFAKVGYGVMTGDDLPATDEPTIELLEKARGGNGAAAASLGRQANVDIVLTGQLQVEMSSMSGGTDVTAQIGNVNLNVKSIIPGNAKIIDVQSAQDRFMSLQQGSALIARQKAIKSAAKRVADKMIRQIPEYLSKAPRTIKVTVGNLDFGKIDDFKALLAKTTGISAVDMINWSQQQTLFDVNAEFTGPKEQDLAKRLLKQYPGASIVALQNYAISIDL
ncbi:flagellar assembly protein T N-terminal domain-containing protein [Alteromonas lipolytica]|uniref:Flagellar assembly protein T N-terminal domain-containing protein n=1 Tax=Alteromonas lipolytica TaxID=1856405 RepID=A0A1E8FKX1_9ALTE|nr:flagellar assembly protein T N-terminal domain-containing protein [Alteromonas lipolytica]OFI36083.1 hypothetical protein BFC17_10485 [Alteromonas lipolytica]GGF71110.1 hypothetical protein GCM10011338_24100 [Alteromonas lipolytica]